MPSSSWYNLDVSLDVSFFAFDVTRRTKLIKVGREVKNIKIKDVKPTTADERSIGDNETRRGFWKGKT